MRRLLLALTVAVCSAVTVISVSHRAEAQMRSADPPYYVLQCRGPLHTDVSAPSGIRSLLVHFRAAPAASGPRGQALGPGQCAWLDRGLRPGEPTTIRFDDAFTSSALDARDRELLLQMNQLVMACARDANCILRVPVRNAGFTTGPNYFIPSSAWVETCPR